MAGRTSGAERDARRILAEAGVAAIDDLRGQVAALEARLAEVERERDEARRQVAAVTEGLRLVSDALARLDQIYRADTDLGDPPVETPAWLQEAKHRAAVLLASATPTPAPTLTDAELRALREEHQPRRQEGGA